MSKRTERIRSLFTTPQAEPLSADNSPAATPRVSSGSVRSLKSSFSDFERENEELRERLASASSVIEIDPALIDPSPVRDRFGDQDSASFEALKASIAKRGQEVPVLLREHPAASGRYQSAYGHRRVRAARELGKLVKAVIRPLSDEDLVVAQGVENSAREDLSLIERATFAARLEDAGHQRSVVQEALAIDRAEASKLLSVARAIPADLVDAIGRAPKVWRGRWQSLSDLLKKPKALELARSVPAIAGFAERDSDLRFSAVLSAAMKASESDVSAQSSRSVTAVSGKKIGRVMQEGREVRLTIDRGTGADFAAFLVEQLPQLFETYVKNKSMKRREV